MQGYVKETIVKTLADIGIVMRPIWQGETALLMVGSSENARLYLQTEARIADIDEDMHGRTQGKSREELAAERARHTELLERLQNMGEYIDRFNVTRQGSKKSLERYLWTEQQIKDFYEIDSDNYHV